MRRHNKAARLAVEPLLYCFVGSCFGGCVTQCVHMSNKPLKRKKTYKYKKIVADDLALTEYLNLLKKNVKEEILAL